MPSSAQALNQQAALLIQHGRFDEAQAHLEECLRLQPDNAEALANLGNVFVYQKKYDEAIAQYQQALRLNPDLFAAHYILAIALYDKGKLYEAEIHFRHALRLNRGYADAHQSLGIALMDQGRLDDAIACFRQALLLKPNFAHACNNLATTLMQQNRLEEAIGYFREAVRLNPQSAESIFNWGIALERQNKLDDAVDLYRQALAINPGYAGAYINLGNIFSRQNRTDEAVHCMQQLLKLEPENAEAWTNLGNIQRDEGRFDEALVSLTKAVQLGEGRPEPHHNRALLRLLMGDWSQGWPEFEWRWRTKEFKDYGLRQPRWDGSPLAGRTILLVAEQGLGDTLQFIRYVPVIQQSGAKVVLLCQAALKRLLTECFGLAPVIVPGDPLPPYDVYAPLLSLPGHLGTTVSNVPSITPYLEADAELVRRWRLELEPLVGFKVAIAWQGSPAYRCDHQRSIPLTHFMRLAEVQGVRLISLQKGPGADQLRSVAGKAPIVDFGSRLDEAAGPFMDTAAIMKNVDLVITSDTAIPHLAGALGVPVWLALPLVPDWRWLLDRADSPWYPSMRIFRQRRRGEWGEVFEAISYQLSAFSQT